MIDRWFTDHPPSTRWPHYTRANAGEVLPTPASPLGQTFAFDQAILPGFETGSISMGSYEEADYRDGAPEMCGFFGGHFYINLSCVRMQAVRNPAITVDQLDMAIFGERADTPPYTSHPEDEKPHLRPKADEHMAFVLSATEWPKLLEQKASAAECRASRPDLRASSDKELVARARELQPHLNELAANNMVTGGSSGIAPSMLAAVGEAIDDPSIPIRLLAGLGEVDSAAPAFAIWELSRLAPESAEFAAAFEEFVQEHGSRGPNEWELTSETWETDPGIALAAIEAARPQPDDKSPMLGQARLAAERDELVAEVRAKLAELGNEELTATFEGALVGGNMMIFRERAKTSLVRVLHEVRMALRELGRRHAEAGNIAEAGHVFMLVADELDGFVADPAAHRDRLADRAAEWSRLWTLEPPFFISDGVVPPLSEWSKKGTAASAAVAVGDELTGVPGSPGVVRGRARIVRDPARPPDLVPGDIMVAPITDPAWTPLFLAVDGVVVNVGGQISHAVIVSRELGLPCVVSVENATERIPDGATVEVDGASGVVRVLEVL